MGEWIDQGEVEVRLLASARPDGAAPVAIVEIRLQPGWKTYWRTPGEGGLPPTFDFSLSRNIAATAVDYPAPRRFDDGYAITNVYQGRVLLPVELTPAVASAPMTVHLKFALGVCESICIPLEIETAVTFGPDEIDPEALAVYDEAVAMLPQPPTPGVFAIDDFELIAKDGAQSYFELVATVPQPFGTELFVEGPAGWWSTAPQQTARDGNRLTYAFTFERPEAAGSLSGSTFTFTLVSAGAAIEQKITLP
jgi:suppressor for copper-sensitivity B